MYYNVINSKQTLNLSKAGAVGVPTGHTGKDLMTTLSNLESSQKGKTSGEVDHSTQC
jgi:hypothetical protein